MRFGKRRLFPKGVGKGTGMAGERTGSNAAARLRHIVCVAAALIVMAVFCGCGGETEETQAKESPKETLRWQGQEFAPPEEPKEGERFYLTGFEEGLGQTALKRNGST